MKRLSVVLLALLGCVTIVWMSARGGQHLTHSKPVNPYYAKFRENVRACEKGNAEWREAEDHAREEAWTKYGERVPRTGLGQRDCQVEAWENMDYLPFAERVEARKQVEVTVLRNSR